jgi:hypothetical protein
MSGRIVVIAMCLAVVAVVRSATLDTVTIDSGQLSGSIEIGVR